ncbi:MAG TPA: hypothetical protein VIO62_12545 [Candidatus Dormibacteraeota bacterium]|jgi:hypothetical protein
MEKKADDTTSDQATPRHHETIIERVGDELESRFLAAAEVATGTTSAETNLANAALRAIEGPAEPAPADEIAPSTEPAKGLEPETK